jgi:hypothetical protein
MLIKKASNRTKILVFNQWKSIEQAKDWLKQKPNLQRLLERKSLGDGGNVCRSRKGGKILVTGKAILKLK